MAIQKTYSFYGDASVPLTSTAELLQFDIANDHIACSLINMGNQAVQAFEFFEWETRGIALENNWESIFSEAAAASNLLQKSVSAVQVFINNATAVIVPLEKFNTEAATDYLQLLFGPAVEASLKHEKIKNTPSLINCYRIPNNLLDVLNARYPLHQLAHAYTPNITGLYAEAVSDKPMLKLQFYKNHFIASLFVSSTLQFIQSFSFISTEDICYHLLHMNASHQIDAANIKVNMMGFIDASSAAAVCVEQIFPMVEYKKPRQEKVLPAMFEAQTAHFFTAFLKPLA
ncbi:MAG: DUF3822 family protein [Sediminibacterium sp.]|jgi:hypothetical protein|nr:DUF3822 family protein [Sediminibacterium sp.]